MKSTHLPPASSWVRLSTIASALALGIILAACGGGDDAVDPDTDVAVAPAPPAANGAALGVFAGQPGTPGAAIGPAGGASLNKPMGIAADASGNLYVADVRNFTVSRITGSTIATVAGSAGLSGLVDGPASSARFLGPQELAAGADGTLYLTDSANGTSSVMVRSISAAGQVSTITDPTTGQPLLTDGSTGIAVDQQGRVYVFLWDPNKEAHVLAQITPAGAVNEIALVSSTGAPVDLFYPQYLAVDRANRLYISDDDADGNAGVLYQVAVNGDSGIATALAGSTSTSGASDGNGSAASFDGLANLAFDASGNIYANDYYNNTIRKITLAGEVSTVAGSPASNGLNLGSQPAPLPYIDALAVLGSTLYFSDPEDSVVLQLFPIHD